MTSLSADRLRKYLATAQGQSCVNCGRKDGTVVAAHYTGLRAALLGKGMGRKPHDLMTAHLCAACHKQADSYEWSMYADKEMRDIDNSEAFLYLIAKTIIRNFENGNLQLG